MWRPDRTPWRKQAPDLYLRGRIGFLGRMDLSTGNEEKEVLLQQSEDTHRVEKNGRVLFKRLHDLRRELGSVTIRAVTSLLPFSRSDYWEVWELHHHLTHSGEAGRPRQR